MGFYQTRPLTCWRIMPMAEYTVYVDGSMVAEVEALCEERDQSASEFFREAARKELQREVDA